MDALIKNEYIMKTMGLFDFLKKQKSGPIIKDWVWINQQDKMNGCLHVLEDDRHATLIAWSTHTQQQFQDFLYKKLGRLVSIDLASHLNPSNETVYFLEHHPQWSKEQALFESVSIREAVFLNALDDPLMQVFGGERIATMMERMGLQEGESITHKMITKSIANAQKKMDESGAIDKQSSTFREWADSIKDY